jgi:putative CocE/NonD family hydrolase
MSDGVRIAVDLALPEGLPAGARIPAVVQLTRYWRARAGQNTPNETQRFFTSYGYAFVTADVRGTGASYGVWTTPWSREEIRDGGELVEWIVRQPWSDGKVGAVGNSYLGTTAQMLAVPNHPAVKAVIPRHYEFDVYTDIAFPGGVFNEWMVKNWDEGNRQLDLQPGVKPVDEDRDGSLLREAVRQHARNIDLFAAARSVTFRDDRPFNNVSTDDFSVHSFRREIEHSQVAINNWGGWMDAGTADGVIRSFATFSNPQRSVVGPWNHGASQNASPSAASPAPGVMQRLEWLRFFDRHLKGLDTGLEREKTLYYYTMGEEKWKATRVWPPAGVSPARWYLSADHALSGSAPRDATAADSYAVDFGATTGEHNRWTTQLGGPVQYPDRAEEDKRLLTYTGPPLAEDTEVTGYPVVTLYAATTATDGAFFVYLEDVDEGGHVAYVTEGVLRATDRKISSEPPPYKQFVPYHSFKRKDALAVTPGEVMELKFGLLPTSMLFRKGHRIRVAIAGHDKSVFARVPSEGAPTISLERDERHASFIELPVVRGPSKRAEPVNLLTTDAGSQPRTSPAAPQPAPAAGVGAKPAEGVKSVEQVLERHVEAVGGRAAYERLTTRVMKGTYSIPSKNYKRPLEVYAKAPDKYAVFIEGQDHMIGYGYDGKTGWDQDFFGRGLRELSGAALAELRRGADFYRQLHLREQFRAMELKGRVSVEGREAYAVEAVPEEGRRVLLYFDARTFLLVRRDVEADQPSDEPLSVTRYEDFREVDGVKIPFRIRNFMTGAGVENVFAFEEARHNVPVPDAKFAKPGAP